jgi:hypothetical protein
VTLSRENPSTVKFRRMAIAVYKPGTLRHDLHYLIVGHLRQLCLAKTPSASPPWPTVAEWPSTPAPSH